MNPRLAPGYRIAANHHMMRAARSVFAKARYRGEIQPKSACEDCGHVEPRGLLAHHEDYAHPLEVNWLCRGCHCKRHSNRFWSGRGGTMKSGRISEELHRALKHEAIYRNTTMSHVMGVVWSHFMTIHPEERERLVRASEAEAVA